MASKPLPDIAVFASGGPNPGEGGSGFQKLVEATHTGILRANIMVVISNYPCGGVMEKARRLGIPFVHFPKPWTANRYLAPLQIYPVEFVVLSGWLKPVVGLDPTTTFNIHPGPLTNAGRPDHFGGKGMYGHHVHEAVLAAFKRGVIDHSEVTMHYVTEGLDDGPVFFRAPVAIMDDDTPETLAKRINTVEHIWQPVITDLVVNGGITWDGRDPATLTLPPGYEITQTAILPRSAPWFEAWRDVRE
jgi:phosphoribosylglycinamide formyltransferase-1